MCTSVQVIAVYSCIHFPLTSVQHLCPDKHPQHDAASMFLHSDGINQVMSRGRFARQSAWSFAQSSIFVS